MVIVRFTVGYLFWMSLPRRGVHPIIARTVVVVYVTACLARLAHPDSRRAMFVAYATDWMLALLYWFGPHINRWLKRKLGAFRSKMTELQAAAMRREVAGAR